jgi:hypothetical protein
VSVDGVGTDIGSQGIGKWWFCKAQPALARVHSVNGSSSRTSYRGRLTSQSGSSPLERDRELRRSTAEAEEQLHTEDFVEARGILLPATEYLKRAVESSQAAGLADSQLLVMVCRRPSLMYPKEYANISPKAAESYMDLGSVSYSPANVEHFQQAVIYLRDAADVPGFTLPRHLRR